MSEPIAIVGCACRFADAASPDELWRNVLAQRRSFRRIPDERLALAHYPAGSADGTYVQQAALLEGWQFSRERFHVSGDAFRATDLAHWLALEVADAALSEAGLPGGAGLPRDDTAVIVGNTLTGEFSRAAALRLRWPYVAAQVAALAPGLPLDALERAFKAPFPTPGEETLAGGLSNTIAGRICNHFDLHGGGFTVDGACSSSLLAVAQACSALAAGEVGAVLAGGVDLSLDPFELVGFARLGALARGDMRVYDRDAAGFLPGEGCGFVLLMRRDEAERRGLRVRAVVRGWAIASDGAGGLTRPEVAGQRRALARAWRRAGVGIESAALLEGHGTGTVVGDNVELRALAAELRGAGATRPVALGSVKANVGHTKAAAGLAGLLKVVGALEAGLIPPATGCEQPSETLRAAADVLRAPLAAEDWPAERPRRAGVSAFGFGGIDVHLVVDGAAARPQPRPTRATAQDAELFLFAAAGADELRRQVGALGAVAAALSQSELGDVAAWLATQPAVRPGGDPLRAAIVAARPDELAARLQRLDAHLAGGGAPCIDARAGLFVGRAGTPPRLVFLFSGQGSPVRVDGGPWSRRFPAVRATFAAAALPDTASVDTQVAQPAIVAASLAGLQLLSALGIEAQAAIGHSLGELSALHWAQALDAATLQRLAQARGRVMGALPGPTGAMVGVAAPAAAVAELIAGSTLVIAAYNGPQQTVIAGPARAAAAALEAAQARGWAAQALAVSHAFHSPLVADAAAQLARALDDVALGSPRRAVWSTVTGARLGADDDLAALLTRQVTEPVRFEAALRGAADGADLLIEVGPGATLAGLARGIVTAPALALDVGGAALAGLLQAVGAAFALGAPVEPEALFAERLTRPFALPWRPRFLANPCAVSVRGADAPGAGSAADSSASGPAIAAAGSREASAPGPAAAAGAGGEFPSGPVTPATGARGDSAPAPAAWAAGAGGEFASGLAAPAAGASANPAPGAAALSPMALLQALLAERTELPASAIAPDSRLLGDLHLSSIAVAQLAGEAARRLGLGTLLSPLSFADATVTELAAALGALTQSGAAPPPPALPPGVCDWVRSFRIAAVEEPPPPPANAPAGRWRCFGSAAHLQALAAALAARLPGDGVLLCLPAAPDERHLADILEAAQAALAAGGGRFVLVQHGGGAASVARTLHLEAPAIAVTVVDTPALPAAVDRVAAEVAATRGYHEVAYDAAGRRTRPVLQALDALPAGAPPFAAGELLLVSGGGKGIGAACALHLARRYGLRLLLLGRAHPDADAELAASLAQMRAAGIAADYRVLDVTDATAVTRVLTEAQAALGPVRAIVHAAGANQPRPLAALDEAAFRRLLAIKVRGLEHLLAAVDRARLRAVVTFGSVIARTGLPGQADYALANEWQTRALEALQPTLPGCRCLAVEWSVWAGVGMGERLGRVEALARAGIMPIAADDGVALLDALLARPAAGNTVVAAGRLPAMPTLASERVELPLWRFLERPRLHVPGVELVVDATLSPEADLYLDDHRFDGARLWPAVMGLEAMAQAAMALVGATHAPWFEDVRFARPVLVDAPTVVQVAALAHDAAHVDVVVRAQATDFQVEHFRARCRFDAPPAAARSPLPDPDLPPLPLAPERDLYGSLLFQRGRFARLGGYRRLGSTGCAFELIEPPPLPFFGGFHPTACVLGDAGARDAGLHALSACVPHARILPVAAARIVPAVGAPPRRGEACERSHHDGRFVYDLTLADAGGAPVERWEGLCLQVVAPRVAAAPWPPPLLAPYLERRFAELLTPGCPERLRLSVGAADADLARQARSQAELARAAGAPVRLRRMPNGALDLPPPLRASTAHAGPLCFATLATAAVGCDAEPVLARPRAVWGELLGEERLALAERLAGESGATLDEAATSVWSLVECLQKIGQRTSAPLALSTVAPDGFSLFTAGAGRLRGAACVRRVAGLDAPIAFALALEEPDERI